MKAFSTQILILYFAWTANSLVYCQGIFDAIEQIPDPTQQTNTNTDFENWKKERESDFANFVKEREEYINRMDSDFTAYIRQHWNEYKSMAGLQVISKPKPVQQPICNTKTPVIKESLGVSGVETSKAGTIPLPILTKTEPANFAKAKADFFFYGMPVRIEYDQRFAIKYYYPVNEEGISNNYEKLSQHYWGSLVTNLQWYKSKLNLNDWAYYLLVQKFSETVMKEKSNSSVYLQWFVMLKSNYKVKLGYSGNQLALLLPIKETVYSTSYIDIGPTRYYIMDSGIKNILTYQKDFPEARQMIELTILSPVYFKSDIAYRAFPIQNDTIKLKYNKNLVNFYKDFPLTNLSVYLNSEISLTTKESIQENISQLLHKKTSKEKIDILLTFVQEMPYKTDIQQFGREKFFFTEEFLHYPASDCEDRSIFLAKLIREIIGTPLIMAEYSDHVCLAIQNDSILQGDYLLYNQKKYFICDPTYKGAPVGLAMDQYRDANAKIITPEAGMFLAMISNKIWTDMKSRGGFPGGNGKDIVFDTNQNAYITGYFSDTLKASSNIISQNQSNDLFIAKYNSKQQLEWVKTYGGSGNDVAYYIELSGNQLFFAGSTDNTIQFGKQTISSNNNTDAFVVNANLEGEPRWACLSGLEKFNADGNQMFVSQFSPDGMLLKTRLIEENENFHTFGIQADTTKEIILSGALFTSGGIRKNNIVLNSYNEVDINKLFSAEKNKLSNQQYHPALVGILSMMNLINSTELSIPGTLVQDIINKNNPVFRSKYPDVYENLGKINFIRNNKGIIVIKTKNSGHVSFSSMKILNDSRIRIFSYNTGNTQIDILSGISVGKAIIWYDLNFIKMIKQNGDLIFDYDNNHSQSKVNISEMLN